MTAASHVLLVHGAWHQGWAWDDLRPHLHRLGLTTAVVDLPSGGGSGDLAADADVVRAALDAAGEPAVLVGHSYGGIPITEASAGRSDVTALVYVCAFQLDVGESLLGALAGEVPLWIAVDEAAGTSSVPEPLPVFFADVDAERASRAAGALTTQTLSSFAAPLTAAGWHDIASTYLACTEDQAIPYPAQQAMSQRSSTVHTLTSSHSPFLSQPGHVASLIAAAAAG